MDEELVKAVSDGKLEKVRRLLDGGASIEVRGEQPLVVLAARGGHTEVVDLLLDRGADMNGRTSRGNTALIAAARSRSLETVRRLLDSGADVNVEPPVGMTALGTAVFLGQRDMVKLLLQHGAEPNRGAAGTPLYQAANRGDVELARCLLEAGADPDGIGAGGHVSALVAAIIGSHEEVVRILLEGGADPNLSADGTMSPLGFAVTRGKTEIARLLIQHGGEERIMGRTIRSLKRPGMKPEMVALLNEATGLDLLDAAEKGDVEGLRELLRSGRDIEAQDDRGRTALFAAAGAGHTECLAILLDQGADPDRVSMHGIAALHQAASKGLTGAVKMLVAHGATVDLPDRHGRTPLLWAALQGQRETAQVFMDAGAVVGPAEAAILDERDRLEELIAADVDRRGSSGMTALMGAAAAGDTALVCELLDRGADIEARSTAGGNALGQAVTYGRVETARALLERGAALTSGKQLLSLLDTAIVSDRGSDEMVRLLLESGSDPNELRGDGRHYPLQWAVMKGNTGIVDALLAAGADPDGPVGARQTPLEEAIRWKRENVEIVRLLLEAGANPNGRDGTINTPLQCAIEKDRQDIVDVLLGNGADPEFHRDWPSKPLARAAVKGNMEIVRMLLEAGAKGGTDAGVSPVLMATLFGHHEVARLLRNLERETSGGETGTPGTEVPSSFLSDVMGGSAEVIESLLSAGGPGLPEDLRETVRVLLEELAARGRKPPAKEGPASNDEG